MFKTSIAGATVSVEHEGTTYTPWEGERQQYKYVIRTEGWEYVGNDLGAPAGDTDESKAMGNLLGFLGACAEARVFGSEDSENWDLFPDHVAEWAANHSTDIEAAELEFDPEI